jgi:hypothetical protein
MADRPIWVEVLLKRHSASHALGTGFLLDLTFKRLAEEADTHEHGARDLRQAACELLSSHEEDEIALSAIIMGVVGLPEDLPRIEPLKQHPSELVRKAASACLFAIGRRKRATS